MKLIAKIFIFLFAALVFNCSKAPEAYESVDEMVALSKSSTQKMEGLELLELMEKGNNFQLIDCREENVYAEGHIPGSINVPRGLIEFSDKISDRRKTTVVFGNDLGSAALAAQTLRNLKYFKCYWVDCTWQKWSLEHPDKIEKGMPDNNKEETKTPSTGGGCGD